MTGGDKFMIRQREDAEFKNNEHDTWYSVESRFVSYTGLRFMLPL
jgi:hypothetical protein